MMKGILALLLLTVIPPSLAGPSFKQLAPIPTARRGSVGAVMKNEIGGEDLWIVGGSNSEISDKDVGEIVEIYLPYPDKWVRGPTMPTSRSDHGAASLNGTSLFVAGGMSECANAQGGFVCNISSVDMFSTESKTWTSLANMNVARRGLALAADEENGLVYAVGGMDCHQDCYGLPVTYLTTVEVYSVATKEWSVLPSMNVGRRDLGAVVVNGLLYAVGGCGGDGSSLDYKHCEAMDAMEVFDPSTNKWTLLDDSPLLTPRHGFALSHYGSSQLLAAGGTSAAGIDAADAQTGLCNFIDSFDFSTNSWFHITEMPDPRDGLAKGPGVLIGNALYLVSGSTKEDAYVDTAEVLNLYC